MEWHLVEVARVLFPRHARSELHLVRPFTILSSPCIGDALLPLRLVLPLSPPRVAAALHLLRL